jgi:hypothetical protein
MAGGAIQVGDRVITLQVPGVFTVTSRQGPMLEIASDKGLQMIVHESSVRRLETSPPAQKS